MLYLSSLNGTGKRGGSKQVLLLILTLAVFLGFETGGDLAANVMDLVRVTENTWSDDFQDMSGLSTTENVQASVGQLVLASDALLGSATSIPISPVLGVQSWGRLYYTATVPLSTALKVDVLDAANVPLMHGVPSGGNLAGIDASTYPGLKLRAVLSSAVAGRTPRLDEWRLTWTPDYPDQIFLPAVFRSFGGSTPPPPVLGAAIGFTGVNDQSPTGRTVRFPSLRKNDAGWDSSFAIQNINGFATTLTLEFFREDGATVYTANGIPLRPHGTYIASLADFSPLADGSYALAVTATEPVVGMAGTRHIEGTMAIAYNGTSQGSQQVLLPLIYKNFLGWTSRLCLHNMSPGVVQVTIAYHDQNGPVSSQLIDIPGNGVNCLDLEQEPLLPSTFVGAALVTSDTNIAVTVENIRSSGNLAVGYLGFDLSAGSSTIYIPRCRKENGWQTSVLATNVGLAGTDVTVTYHESEGNTGYTYTYPGSYLGTGFACPNDPPPIIIPPPPPFPYRLGSAILSMSQSKLIALAIEMNASSGTDGFSFSGLSMASTVVYAPNVGGGLDNWKGSLSIQNPGILTNTVTISFYNRAGDVLYELSEDLPPNGMGQFDVAQLPGLSASYEGSAIIFATHPVAVLVSKER